MTLYSRRVSFNSLNPDLNEPVTILPDNIDINFGYGSSGVNDISKIFSTSPTYTLSSPTSTSQIGSKKLKKNPSKSILKNKLNHDQLRHNLNSQTINYHEVDMDNDSDDDNNKSEEKFIDRPEERGRRKSYSEMTNEELMALDPQFQVPKTSNLDSYKFDNQKTYYLKNKKNYNVFNTAKNKLSPSHNYKLINLTIQNKKYDSTHERTILSLINGRKHTWNTIDWLISSNFLQDNDYIIISSLVPKQIENELNYKQILFKKCENIVNWLFSCDQLVKLNLKITVELVIDDSNSTKNYIRNLFLQYNPNVLVFGSKRHNLNFKYPVKRDGSGFKPPPSIGGISSVTPVKEKVKGQYIVKLPSYLIKYSSIPTIIVNPPLESSTVSCSSSSIDSDLIEGISKPPIDYSNINTYKNLLLDISTKSLEDLNHFLNHLDPVGFDGGGVKFNDSTKFDSKLHSIYSSQRRDLAKSSHEGMYKVKSLIDDAQPITKKNSLSSLNSNLNLGKVQSTGALTNKMIKSSLKKEPMKPEKKKSFWKKVFS